VLEPSIEAEIASLAERYGQPRRVTAELERWYFTPMTMSDRYGEVCMVVRRPNGKLITAKKTFYPAGAFRLLTGGVGHGEAIAGALAREVAEETGLDVSVRRFLAVIEYHLATTQGDGETGRRGDGETGRGLSTFTPSPPRPLAPSPLPSFATFAFLLDEIGGTLHARDAGERIEAFRELEVAELPALAATLENVSDRHGDEIEGSWRDWGRFRAVGHRVIYEALSGRQ
jgi:8-oxo-dGTP pyrophosphatase MutT (NUDIX family)